MIHFGDNLIVLGYNSVYYKYVPDWHYITSDLTFQCHKMIIASDYNWLECALYYLWIQTAGYGLVCLSMRTLDGCCGQPIISVYTNFRPVPHHI